MILRVSAVLAAVLTAVVAAPVSAETRPVSADADTIVVAQADSGGTARRARKRSESRPKREPTASQMAARERQKKCAAEWKSAKAGGSVASEMKWPKFWSQCNARLKGNSA